MQNASLAFNPLNSIVVKHEKLIVNTCPNDLIICPFALTAKFYTPPKPYFNYPLSGLIEDKLNTFGAVFYLFTTILYFEDAEYNHDEEEERIVLVAYEHPEAYYSTEPIYLTWKQFRQFQEFLKESSPMKNFVLANEKLSLLIKEFGLDKDKLHNITQFASDMLTGDLETETFSEYLEEFSYEEILKLTDFLGKANDILIDSAREAMTTIESIAYRKRITKKALKTLAELVVSVEYVMKAF